MAPLFHRPRRRPSKPAARWPQLHDPLQVALINEPPELPPSKLHNKDLSLLPPFSSLPFLCVATSVYLWGDVSLHLHRWNKFCIRECVNSFVWQIERSAVGPRRLELKLSLTNASNFLHSHLSV